MSSTAIDPSLITAAAAIEQGAENQQQKSTTEPSPNYATPDHFNDRLFYCLKYTAEYAVVSAQPAITKP
jgi:hypothetical protein